ncbi:protein terminal ear1-like [Senna tora]|uniref:Protein terminal ear1-like n=1 Tax=Senna tora TaxID=362788 RepID=A0A834X7Q0_9FABA|nr:protein terminal ear1-like [Senna tora]
MAETGIVRFPGSLDPHAEEFIPRNIPTTTTTTTTQLYYPYAPTGALQLHALAVGVPYPHFSAPTAYVSQLAVAAAAAPPAAAAPSSTSPTRSLLLSSVPPSESVSESALRRELEVFGDVRGVQMERLRDGIVTVHFYDLRHAEMALVAIRKQHMQQQTRLRNYYASLMAKTRNSALPEPPPPPPPPAAATRGLIAGRAVWAQYIVPPYNAVPDGPNQGTIVIFNLDSEVSAETLRQTFEAFGPVKELRDTPSKKNQRFVEFFDTRDAAKALKQMNGKQIHGKAVVIEFSRPGGHGRKFFNALPAATTIPKMPLNLQPKPHSPPPPPPLPRKNSRRFAPPPPQPQLSSKQPSSNKNTTDSECVETTVSGVETTVSGSTKQHHHQQQQVIRSRNWKGKQGKKQESRFLIKEDAIEESSLKDSRTTVMIKNIPNKYSQKLLLNMLDNHCIHCNEQIGDGDDQPLSNKCNVGYGFVNMTSPEATLRLYKAFHLQHWEVFNSRKICEVTYARVQGVEALKEHFKNSKFPCEMEHYLPVVFLPPRDGRQLTEPLPIVGQKQGVSNSKADEDEIADGEERVEDSGISQNGVAVEGVVTVEEENEGEVGTSYQSMVLCAITSQKPSNQMN